MSFLSLFVEALHYVCIHNIVTIDVSSLFSVSFEQIGILHNRFKQLSHNEETLLYV